MSQKKFFLGSLILIMLVSLLEPLPGIAAEKTSPQPASGGILRLPSYGKPAPMNPFTLLDTISVHLFDLVFSKLVRWSSKNEFEGDLAERWEISSDGRIYTFYLRKGIKFHDGSDCTAEDVLYSFQLFSKKEISPVYHRYFDVVEKWEASSESVFRVTLKKPYAPFLWSIWKVVIVPKELLYPWSSKLQHQFIEHPIGTGPFKFLKHDKNGMFFLRYEKYFNGIPSLEKIEVISLDKDKVWPAFLRNEVDVAFYLDRKDYLQIKENPSFHAFRVLSPSGYALIFNLHDPILKDLSIRTAIARAIDRSELINRLEEGEGVLANGPFHPELWSEGREPAEMPYEPEKARSLLRSAGFGAGEEGVQRRGALFLDLKVDEKNKYLLRMAKLIRQQLSEVGVHLQISFYSDFKDITDRIYQNKFQSFLFTYHAAPDFDLPANKYWDAQRGAPYHWGNYQNPEVESLLNLATLTFERHKREEIYRQVSEMAENDKPAVFLYFPYIYFAISNHVEFPPDFFSLWTISFRSLKDVHVISESK